LPARPDLHREAAAWSEGRLLLGVDEVGRGPLAGPVVAAAVVFPASHAPLDGVRDSKTLSAAHRERLAPAIRLAAVAVAVGAASVAEIDRLNIRVATALAMRRAVERVLDPQRHGAPSPLAEGIVVLLDGLPMPELRRPHQALVDGDALCYTVAAAGILAKTVRDRLMGRLAGRYPGFGWESNMGYGTAGHLAALAARGPTRHHRRSFSPVSQMGLWVKPSS
jgi:ribonuclease HII